MTAKKMPYITDQSSAQLRENVRKLQRMPCSADPLVGRLYAEILALDAELMAERWLPIASAPKDGSLILLGLPETENTRAVSTPGFWQKGWPDSVDVMGCDDGFIDVNCQEFTPSRSFGDQAYRDPGGQPTRWQPLPAPPKA